MFTSGYLSPPELDSCTYASDNIFFALKKGLLSVIKSAKLFEVPWIILSQGSSTSSEITINLFLQSPYESAL